MASSNGPQSERLTDSMTRSVKQTQIQLLRELQAAIDCSKKLLNRIAKPSVGFDAESTQNDVHLFDAEAIDRHLVGGGNGIHADRRLDAPA